MSIDDLRARARSQQAQQHDDGGDRPPIWAPRPGDELHGRVVAAVERPSKYDDAQPYTDLTVERGDGSCVVVRCGRAVLRRLVEQHTPQQGDEIYVAYQGPQVSEATGRTFHAYVLACDRGDGGSDIPADTAGLPPAPQPTAAADNEGLPF